MVLFELPYSQVEEVEVEFYGLRFENSKIFFRKKYGTYPGLGQRIYLESTTVAYLARVLRVLQHLQY